MRSLSCDCGTRLGRKLMRNSGNRLVRLKTFGADISELNWWWVHLFPQKGQRRILSGIYWCPSYHNRLLFSEQVHLKIFYKQKIFVHVGIPLKMWLRCGKRTTPRRPKMQRLTVDSKEGFRDLEFRNSNEWQGIEMAIRYVSRQIVLVGLKQDLVEDENEVWRKANN